MLQEHIPAVEVTLVQDAEALWTRRAEWNALVERSATQTVFQTLDWQRSWWRTLGRDARLLVVLVEAAGEIVAIAPLMVQERRILGRDRRVVEFIGAEAADYCDFIVEPRRADLLPLMLECLVAHRSCWDAMRLLNIAATSSLPALLPIVFGPRGYATDVQPLAECPAWIFGDAAADRRLPRKKKIREHHNRLRRQGSVSFRRYAPGAQMDAALEAFFEQHVERWAGSSTPSLFLDVRQRQFYRELARAMAADGRVLFSAVLLDGAPVSFHFGFEHARRIYWIKPAFDPAYARYSPGMLHIKYLLEYAMARNAAEIDFTVGEEAYKYRFANHVRVNCVARVHPRWMFYGLDRVLTSARAAARKAPLLRRLGRRLVGPLLGGAP